MKKTGRKIFLFLLFFGVMLAMTGKINVAHAYLRDVIGTPTYAGWGTAYTMGYRFTPTTSGNITKLWCYSSGASTVTLWSDAGASLRSTGITCSAAWVSADITPVAVTAGTYYRVSVWGGNYYGAITVPNTTTGITISGSYYSAGANVFPQLSGGGTMYGVADVTWAAATKANGEACTLGSECTSTYCVDGVCCNSTCTGSTCQICNSSSNAGAGTCGYISTAIDPDSECGALDCDGGATKYYSGWASNVCYYKADVSAADAVCTGTSLACKTAADQCPSSTQGASTGVTRTVCQTQVGCTGTTAGSTGYVTDGSDTYSDCTGLDCDGGATKYYSGWASNVCYYKADVSAADHVCDGAGVCKTAAVQCPSSTQGASTGVTRTACKTQLGCTGTTAGSLGNESAGSDTNDDCASYECTSKVDGWSGNDCKAAVATANDGDCNGAGACYSSYADSCTSGGSILASCGSSECKRASVCVQGDASTTSDTVEEICYISGQNECSTNYACEATGTCKIPDCTTVPTNGDYTLQGTACAFPATTLINGRSYNGVDAVGTNDTNSAKLTIGTGTAPETASSLTVLGDQTIAVGSLGLVNGSVTIIDGGEIKVGEPLYLTDADGDGYPNCSSTGTQYPTSTTNRARRGATCDANDAQACAAGDTPVSGVPGSALVGTTCKKCVSGALEFQALGEDLSYDTFPTGQCSASSQGCSGSCVTTGSDGNCNGFGACNTGGNVAAGKVCFEGSQVDATSQALACDADTNYSCVAGSCSGYYRWSECNGAGSCDTAATTYYTQTNVNATVGQSLSATCTSGANGNPGATCQKCNGSGSLTVQASNEDLYNQCALAYSSCSTTCVKTGTGDNCSGSSATCGTADATNVAAGKVCSGGAEVDATSQGLACDANTNYSCAAGSCSGYYRWSECNGAGSCDTAATTYYTQTNVNATVGQSLSATCTSGANGNPGATCQKCNGSGSLTAQTTSEDIYNQCTATACVSGLCNGASACAAPLDYGFEGSCPACQMCGGSTSCVAMTNNTQDTVGSNLCNGTCKKCSSGSCVNQALGEDLFNQCAMATPFGISNYGTGSTCTALCGTYLCPSGNCSASGACGAGNWCICSSVGTDAGYSNGLRTTYSGGCTTAAATCATGMTNLGQSCGGATTNWTYCKCAYQ